MTSFRKHAFLPKLKIVQLAVSTNSSSVEQLNLQIWQYAPKTTKTMTAWPMLVMLGILDQVDPGFREEAAAKLGLARFPLVWQRDMQKAEQKAHKHTATLIRHEKRTIAKNKALNSLLRRLAISGDNKRNGASGIEGHGTFGRFALVALLTVRQRSPA